MRTQTSQTFRKFFGAILVAAVIGIFCLQGQAATLSPKLQNQLTTLADNVSVGVVIVSFNTSTGLNESHLNLLRGVGVTGGQTFLSTFNKLPDKKLPMSIRNIPILQTN